MQLKERVPGEYTVQWQVPTALPLEAMPVPALPDTCKPQGPQSATEQPGSWVFRRIYKCPDGIAGRRVGVVFPVVNPSITTLIRLELLSGEQWVHVMQPGESSWQVPNRSSEPLSPKVRQARRALLQGASHLFGHWLHFAFLLAMYLARPGGESTDTTSIIRIVSGFTVGQILGAVGCLITGMPATLLPRELGIAIAIVILAGQALRGAKGRSSVLGVALMAGLLHGTVSVGLADPNPDAGPTWWLALAAILGMDALLLMGGLAVVRIGKLVVRWSISDSLARFAGYGLGGLGVAAALAIALLVPESGVAESGSRLTRLPGLSSGSMEQGTPASRRVAPSFPDVPIQSFLAIEPFEVRHEILIRPSGLPALSGFQGIEKLEVDRHPEFKARVGEFVTSHTTMTINGSAASPLIERIDFLSVSPTGVLPRPSPIAETFSEAWVGATVLYVTPSTPGTVALTWSPFPDIDVAIPTLLTDPEVSRSSMLSNADPRLVWKNELEGDPAPTLVAVRVEPTSFSVPTISLALLALIPGLLVGAIRGRRRALAVAATRVALALSLLLAPVAQVAVALPITAGALPAASQARSLLASTLRNVYRALEIRDESAAYDRLSVSVTGNTLSEIYLEHRRAMEMEERGGARARVEAVEVRSIRSVKPSVGGGLSIEAVWRVGGTVTHFGHRHFRQNQYDALVTMVADEGVWKISTIEIFDEERLR